MPEKDIKDWACPRCQTSPCTGATCETCGAAPDWKRPAKKPLETPQEAARREARRLAEADAEAKHQERMARDAAKAEEDRAAKEAAAAQKKKEDALKGNEALLAAISELIDQKLAAKQ